MSHLSKASGVATDTLKKILDGQKTVLATTHEAIVAARPFGQQTTLVSAQRSAELITRMRKKVHLKDIADMTGIGWRHLYGIQHGYRGKKLVQARTALKIEDAATKLGCTKVKLDEERYLMERSLGLPIEVCADIAGIDPRTAWRVEQVAS